MFDLLIAVLMGFFLGLAYAFLARYLAGRAEEPAWETLLLAAGLAVAALIYVGFALTGGAPGTWMLRELAGLALFGFIAWQGWKTSTLWLALGWGGHSLWDAVLHWSSPGALYTPRWYVLLCIGFDLAVAVWILLVRRGGSAAPRFKMPPV